MPSLDIHVVANSITPQLEAALLAYGYSEKQVVGGDPRVRMKKLLSAKFDTKEAADDLFSRTITAINNDGGFVGYVEEEIITDDLRIIGEAGAAASETLSEHLAVSAGPPGRYKGCDIHASMVSPSNALRDRLLAAGLYYLVLRKPGLGDVTIFTIQTELVPEGRRLQRVLTEHLSKAGDFDGMIKFEVTRAIRNFGLALPPIVLAENSRVPAHSH